MAVDTGVGVAVDTGVGVAVGNGVDVGVGSGVTDGDSVAAATGMGGMGAGSSVGNGV